MFIGGPVSRRKFSTSYWIHVNKFSHPLFCGQPSFHTFCLLLQGSAGSYLCILKMATHKTQPSFTSNWMKNHPQIMKNQGPSIKLLEIDSINSMNLSWICRHQTRSSKKCHPSPPLPPPSPPVPPPFPSPFPPSTVPSLLASRPEIPAVAAPAPVADPRPAGRFKIHQCRKGIRYE